MVPLFFVFFFSCRARDALRQCIPDALKDPNFATAQIQEESVQRWFALLLKNLEPGNNAPSPPISSTGTAQTPAATTAAPTAAAIVSGLASGNPPPGVSAPAAPPALLKANPTPSGPPGVPPPATTLNFAAQFKREPGSGWNT